MLAQASTIHVVAESLKKYDVSFSVVDPVSAKKGCVVVSSKLNFD